MKAIAGGAVGVVITVLITLATLLLSGSELITLLVYVILIGLTVGLGALYLSRRQPFDASLGLDLGAGNLTAIDLAHGDSVSAMPVRERAQRAQLGNGVRPVRVPTMPELTQGAQRERDGHLRRSLRSPWG